MRHEQDDGRRDSGQPARARDVERPADEHRDEDRERVEPQVHLLGGEDRGADRERPTDRRTDELIKRRGLGRLELGLRNRNGGDRGPEAFLQSERPHRRVGEHRGTRRHEALMRAGRHPSQQRRALAQLCQMRGELPELRAVGAEVIPGSEWARHRAPRATRARASAGEQPGVSEQAHPAAVLAPPRRPPGMLHGAKHALGVRHDRGDAPVGTADAGDPER